MGLLTITDIQVGQEYREVWHYDEEKVGQFIALSHDNASVHTKKDFSERQGYTERVVHGILLSIPISRILGKEIPGENTVIGSLNLNFSHPVYVGDRVEYLVKVERVIPTTGCVGLTIQIKKLPDQICVHGKAICFFKDQQKFQGVQNDGRLTSPI